MSSSITCREAILQAFAELERPRGRACGVEEVVLHLKGAGFKESTIRTHIVSRMCAGAPPHHGTRYDDLDRVDRGRYRLSAKGWAALAATR